MQDWSPLFPYCADSQVKSPLPIHSLDTTILSSGIQSRPCEHWASTPLLTFVPNSALSLCKACRKRSRWERLLTQPGGMLPSTGAPLAVLNNFPYLCRPDLPSAVQFPSQYSRLEVILGLQSTAGLRTTAVAKNLCFRNPLLTLSFFLLNKTNITEPYRAPSTAQGSSVANLVHTWNLQRSKNHNRTNCSDAVRDGNY